MLLAMATEILNINGWDSGWPIGVASDDAAEAVAAADGSFVACSTEGDVVLFDLDNTGLTDADTISEVDVILRGRQSATSSGANAFAVEFWIGGSIQGTAQTTTGALTTSFQNFTLSTDAWDVDWTQAQLDGAQVQVTAAQTGMPSSAQWEVDCLDVVITYTAAGETVFQPRMKLLGVG
jgi:hypothetical protein